MRTPDVIIGGAPRCGTTSLYEYLRHHPQLYFPAHKEPHYFCDDLPEIRAVKSFSDYRQLFDRASCDQLCGEASTNYFFSKVAFKNVLRANSDCKVIILIRSPLDLVHSLHRYLVNRRIEPISDFLAAFQAGELRDRIPKYVQGFPYPGHVCYRNVLKVSSYVRTIQNVVPRSQLLLLTLNDVRDSAASVYVQVLQFLGVSHDGRQVFPVVNDSVAPRWNRLSQLVMYPPQPIAALKSKLRRVAHSFGIRPGIIIHAWLGRKPFTKDALAMQTLMNELSGKLSREIDELEMLLGRDLSDWRSPTTVRPSDDIAVDSYGFPNGN